MVPFIIKTQKASIDSRKVGNAKLTGILPAISQAPKIMKAETNFKNSDRYCIKACIKAFVSDFWIFEKKLVANTIVCWQPTECLTYFAPSNGAIYQKSSILRSSSLPVNWPAAEYHSMSAFADFMPPPLASYNPPSTASL